ncbi:MAG: hypothetical protein RRA94_15830, partial [Bacteroidota bacterium]|nr:hypothetical protein [Bacteroidota bacterium]
MKLTRKALRVAWWEFIERVKTKSFLIGLFLTPAIMVLFAAGPALLKDSLEHSESLHIAVHDASGIVFDSLASSLAASPKLDDGTPRYTLERVEAADRDMAQIKADIDSALLRDSIVAGIIIPAAAADSHRIEYRSKNVSDIEGVIMLERRISRIISEHKIANAGLDPARVRDL